MNEKNILTQILLNENFRTKEEEKILKATERELIIFVGKQGSEQHEAFLEVGRMEGGGLGNTAQKALQAYLQIL